LQYALGQSHRWLARLSYTWKYAIGDIADSLEHWSRASFLDPKEVYIWICWACVNQHRVQEMRRKGEVVPFEEFKEVFEGRVKSIGKQLGPSWTSASFG